MVRKKVKRFQLPLSGSRAFTDLPFMGWGFKRISTPSLGITGAGGTVGMVGAVGT